MSTTKAGTWNGYYHDYLIRARARGIEPVALLDEEWFDGKTTAHTSVLPHRDFGISCSGNRLWHWPGQPVCGLELPDTGLYRYS